MKETVPYNKRIYKIDNIRAIAILLVVFGHSIILYSSSWNLYSTTNNVPVLNICKDFINIIQMPLFFALSGFLFTSSLKKEFSVVMKDKTKRLLVPYFIIALFWLIPIRLSVNYPGYNVPFLTIIGKCILYGSDNGHLWYLIALFWCFIFCRLLTAVIRNIQSFVFPTKKGDDAQYITVTVLFISWIMFILSKKVNLYYFNSTFDYFVWFMLGIMIKKHFNFINNLGVVYKGIILILCLLLTL